MPVDLTTAAARRSEWLESANERIDHLAELPHNWDGYGSPAISQPALDGAAQLMSFLASELPPIPTVGPVPGGGLQLEWRHGVRELELELLPNGTIEYLTVECSEMREDTLALADFGTALKLVRWVLED